MRRLLLVAATIVGCLSSASLASAAPITLTYSGTWNFYDPIVDLPTFWSALSDYGVTEGTTFSFSMSIDDKAPHIGGGTYLDAIVRSEFRAGSLTIGCELAGCSAPANGGLGGYTQVGPSDFIAGPGLPGYTPISGGFVPSFLFFRASPLIGSDSLTEALANSAGWQNPSLMIGFRDGPNGPGGGGVFLGTSALTFVSKTAPVPEPGSLVLALVGGTLAVAWRVRAARARRKAVPALVR